MISKYDEDYFEHGISKNISLYENFRWMPERTIPEAHWIINYLNMDRYSTIIDYGCAKGFHVKALRLLGYEAFGYDVSEYALSCADQRITKYLYDNINGKYNCGFCKDTLEHCEDMHVLIDNIKLLSQSASRWLIIVPNAKKGKYIIKEYESDKTHIIRLNKRDWDLLLTDNGFTITEFAYKMYGLKNNWAKYKTGNLFYLLVSKHADSSVYNSEK